MRRTIYQRVYENWMMMWITFDLLMIVKQVEYDISLYGKANVTPFD